MREHLRFDKIQDHYTRRALLILIFPFLVIATSVVHSFRFLREIAAVAPKEFMDVWREPNRY